MMSKYQLVFVKLESSLIRTIRSRLSRERVLLLRAFTRWWKKKYIHTIKANAINEFATSSIRSSLRNCLSLNRKTKLFYLRKRLLKWKISSKHATIAKRTKVKFQAESAKLRKAIEEKDEVIKTNSKACHTLTSKIAELNSCISKLKEEQKKGEEQEKSLRTKLEAMKKKDMQSKDDKINQLKNQIAFLESDNNELKQKIDSTEASVASFIQEMNQLVDNQEFSNLPSKDKCNMILLIDWLTYAFQYYI